MTTPGRNASKHANTPEQARANARMAKLRREGAVPERTPNETRRALQRKLYNARIRATERNDEDALAFIAELLEELNATGIEDDPVEAELRRVDEAYQSWQESRGQRGSATGTEAAVVATARIPLLLEPQPEGGYTVTSPLLPELVTEGDTIAECLVHAEDAFAAVTEMYADWNRPLPSSIYVEEAIGPLLIEALVPFPDA